MEKLEIHVGNVITFLKFGYDDGYVVYGSGFSYGYGNYGGSSGKGDGWGYYKTKDRQLVGGNGDEKT